MPTSQLLLSAIFSATLLLIMLHPRNLSEAWTACGGALLVLVGGFVTPAQALGVLVQQWNVFGFFLGLMIIAAVADHGGFFDAVAYSAARAANGSGLRLYLAVFAIGTVITAVLSNDATALILTPIVYTLVMRLRLKVLPFMFACTFVADTASFLLPVSNPINILVLSSFGGTLGEFLRFLLLPSLFCIAVNIAVFVVVFRRDVTMRYDLALLDAPMRTPAQQQFFRFVVGGLVLIAAGYVLGSVFLIPLSFVALGGAVVLLAGAAGYGQFDARWVGRDISWSIFGFIGGMFIVVQAVENVGLTAAFGDWLLGGATTSPLWSVLRVTVGTALGANVINNVPMTIVMVSALRSQPALDPALHTGVVYATIFGADVGPNLTTVGSLATILWLLILRRKGLDVSSFQYFKLGLCVVPLMVLGGALLIWLAIIL